MRLVLLRDPWQLPTASNLKNDVHAKASSVDFTPLRSKARYHHLPLSLLLNVLLDYSSISAARVFQSLSAAYSVANLPDRQCEPWLLTPTAFEAGSIPNPLPYERHLPFHQQFPKQDLPMFGKRGRLASPCTFKESSVQPLTAQVD